MSISLSRRELLARVGMLGAATAAAGLLPGMRVRADAQPIGDLLEQLVDGGRPLMQQLALDTISGLSVMLLPGSDPYSQAQGLTDDRPGGIEARNPEFMMGALDTFFPLPDAEVEVLARAFATGVSGVPIPAEFLDGLLAGSEALDDAVLTVLQNDEEAPLSLLIAMLLNFVASTVDPSSIAATATTGFVSPFANLSIENKIEVFRVMEEDTVELLAAIDANLPEPSTESLSGLVAFVPGALVEFVGFGGMSEFGLVSPDDHKQLTGRPVGWDLTGFQPGMLRAGHGWDEFIGYFGDVRAVEGSWDTGA